MNQTNTIPVVDMAPYFHGGIAGKRRVAAAIHAAAHDVGFTYLENLTVPGDLLKSAFEVSRSLFETDEKWKVPFDVELNHGYAGVQQEALDPSQPADLKEAFTMRDVERTATGPRYWPSREFEVFMRTFYDTCRRAAADVMGAFALALDLPEDFFNSRHTGVSQTLRLLRYPPAPAALSGQLGAGAHTDYGTLTLLFQDGEGGLQVRNADGMWIDAPPIEGAVVVNTGDLMARWGNDVYRSTEHRVSPRLNTTRPRHSIAFFSDPDPDVVIEPFPNCVTRDNPARYPPITAGEHIRQKIVATQTR